MKLKSRNKKKQYFFDSSKKVYLASLLLSMSLIGIFWLKPELTNQRKSSQKCFLLELTDNIPTSIENDQECYQFYAESGQEIKINANKPIELLFSNKIIQKIQGSQKLTLLEDGEYSLILKENRQVSVTLASPNIAENKKSKSETISSDHDQIDNSSNQSTNNLTVVPPFQSDRRLQTIVDSLVTLAQQRNLNVDKLSISLVDLKSQDTLCCSYASFADNQPRYPASVVKLFWMVVLFSQYEANKLQLGTVSQETLIKMIKDSDNEASSRVLDIITNTESGSALKPAEIQAWKNKRDKVNEFFQQRGYQNLNISQKTFPIPYLQMNEPIGRDKQIRSHDLKIPDQENNPIRNFLTTYTVAKLLYEIRSQQLISPESSTKMDQLLTRNLNPVNWKNKPYNSIEGFLGEGLPENAHLSSKMGWTFNNRNDAAIIASPDGKAHYILVIFGDDKTFYGDKSFLPEASQFVYQQMLLNHP